MIKIRKDITIDWKSLNNQEKKHVTNYITQKVEGYNLHEYRLIFDENPLIHVLYHADGSNPSEGYKRVSIPVRKFQHDEIDRVISLIFTSYDDFSPKEKQGILNDFIANGSILVNYKVKYAVFLFDEDEIRREESEHQDEIESEEEEKERHDGFRNY